MGFGAPLKVMLKIGSWTPKFRLTRLSSPTLGNRGTSVCRLKSSVCLVFRGLGKRRERRCGGGVGGRRAASTSRTGVALGVEGRFPGPTERNPDGPFLLWLLKSLGPTPRGHVSWNNRGPRNNWGPRHVLHPVRPLGVSPGWRGIDPDVPPPRSRDSTRGCIHGHNHRVGRVRKKKKFKIKIKKKINF